MDTRRLKLQWTAGGWRAAEIVPKLSNNLDSAQSFISPNCRTAAELDEAIDALIADLEVLRAEGRRRFAQAAL